MREITKRWIFFVVSIVIIVSVLANIIYTFFVQKVYGIDLSYISAPIKNIIFSQYSILIIIGLLALLLTAIVIDSLIEKKRSSN